MSAFEDIDLTPPDKAHIPDDVSYLHENFSRVKEELGGGFGDTGDGWVALTLLNGWVNFSTNYPEPRFRTHPGGLIEIQGLIKDGTTTVDTPICLMPVGARSAFQQFFAVPTQGGIGSIYFKKTTFEIRLSVTGTWISINIMFYADDYAAP